MAIEISGDAEWILVIKTDAYAGNFERGMCGYCTGMVGDCGVGEEEAQIFYDEMGLTPDDFNWKDGGVDVKYISEDWDNPFGLVVTSRADDHGCRRPTTMCDSDPDDRNTAVAIFFSKKPTDELINTMMERAYRYCQEYCPNNESEYMRHKINIKGFELWREETKQFQEQSWPAR